MKAVDYRKQAADLLGRRSAIWRIAKERAHKARWNYLRAKRSGTASDLALDRLWHEKKTADDEEVRLARSIANAAYRSLGGHAFYVARACAGGSGGRSGASPDRPERP